LGESTQRLRFTEFLFFQNEDLGEINRLREKGVFDNIREDQFRKRDYPRRYPEFHDGFRNETRSLPAALERPKRAFDKLYQAAQGRTIRPQSMTSIRCISYLKTFSTIYKEQLMLAGRLLPKQRH
jgi:hypothetical protein